MAWRKINDSILSDIADALRAKGAPGGSAGKNKFDKDNYSVINAYLAANETQWLIDSGSSSLRVACEPNTTYTASVQDTSVTLFRVAVTDSAAAPTAGKPVTVYNEVRGTSAAPITVTTGANARYLVVQMNNGLFVSAAEGLQVEEGATATDYEPYAKNSATLPCDLYEGDVWYPMTGLVERKMQMRVLDGTESWSQYATQAKRWQLLVGNKSYGRFACTHYQRDTAASGLIANNGYAKCVDGERIRFADERFANVAEWKAWLAAQYAAGTPVIVVYELRAPIVESDADNGAPMMLMGAPLMLMGSPMVMDGGDVPEESEE